MCTFKTAEVRYGEPLIFSCFCLPLHPPHFSFWYPKQTMLDHCQCSITESRFQRRGGFLKESEEIIMCKVLCLAAGFPLWCKLSWLQWSTWVHLTVLMPKLLLHICAKSCHRSSDRLPTNNFGRVCQCPTINLLKRPPYSLKGLLWPWLYWCIVSASWLVICGPVLSPR